MLGRLSLESQQKVHNRVISTDHRVKLPRRKVGSDTSDTILTGASIEAARRAHGNISEEEVLEKLSRELRVQKRADETTTMSDIARRYEQAENTLIDAPPQEIAGVGLQEMVQKLLFLLHLTFKMLLLLYLVMYLELK